MSNYKVVEKGDYITYNPNNQKEANIRWQQDLGMREVEYIVLPYSVKGKEASGSLYLDLGFADSFFVKSSKEENDNPLLKGRYKVEVDSDFQYGQNSDKSLRFLVFHNKSNKPHQHRYIETSAFQNIAHHLVEMAAPGAGAWAGVIKQSQELGKAFIGDYLKNF